MALPTTDKYWSAKLLERKSIAQDTYEMEFEVTDSDFSFRAGQYVWVVVPELLYPDSRGNRRAFSICTSPRLGNRFAIVFRESNSGFKKTLLELPVNSEVSVVGPFGYLDFPTDSTTPVVFVAGGVGVAPFMSMIRTVAENNSRKITLLYVNTAPEKVVYADELAQISSQNSMIVLKQKIGEVDWEFISQSVNNINGVVWYIVGSEKMVQDVAGMLYKNGVEERNVRFEEFYVTKDYFDGSDNEMWGTVGVFKLAVESSFNHIILTDLNGKIIFANLGAEKITGFTKDEMVGQNPRLWGGLMDKAYYENLWRTIKVEKKPFEGEIQNRRKNGEFYRAIARISPIFDKGDNLIGFMGTEEDITQILDLDKKLRSKVDELEKINEFMVGREIRISELKNEVAELKSRIDDLVGTGNPKATSDSEGVS